MDRKNLLFIVGARPNFVKVAPICRVLQKAYGLPFQIVHTGQHYDWLMSDVFFRDLEIPAPDYHLNIGSGPHGRQTGAMMAQLEEICLGNAFAALVVIGDVNSTLAGALVGAKLNTPVAHIESGLRSFNRSMPEEINRIAVDHVSDLLFAPSQVAMQNLRQEGLGKRAFFSGDVMYDMIRIGLEQAQCKSNILEQLELEPKQYCLATLHRPYNVDEPRILREIMAGLSGLGEKVLLSAHPRLEKNLKRFRIPYGSNIRLTAPFGYLDFIVLEKNARRIFTDSGGIQKEAFFLQTPCITLRPETEWVETVAAGANLLVKKRTIAAVQEAANFDFHPRYETRPYGDGYASQTIIEILQNYLYKNTHSSVSESADQWIA